MVTNVKCFRDLFSWLHTSHATSRAQVPIQYFFRFLIHGQFSRKVTLAEHLSVKPDVVVFCFCFFLFSHRNAGLLIKMDHITVKQSIKTLEGLSQLRLGYRLCSHIIFLMRPKLVIISGQFILFALFTPCQFLLAKSKDHSQLLY